MTFWELADSSLLWILVSVGLLFVLGLAVVFFLMARKRCIELGIEQETVNKVIRSSISFCIVPSFSIVIGLVSLSGLLGRAWSWFRLSVVGAVTYELMSADLAAKALGVENLGEMRNTPAMYFGAVMFVMGVGILAGNLTNIFVGKKMTTSLLSYTKKSGGWGALMTNSFMLTMIAVFVVVQFFGGLIPALTLASSFIISLLLGFAVKKFKIAWLGEYILAITLLLGMASGYMWSQVLG